MLLDEGMDTGPIIAQAEYTLSGEETAETSDGSPVCQGLRSLDGEPGPLGVRWVTTMPTG